METRLLFSLLGKKNGFDMKTNLELVRRSQYWTPEQVEAYQMKYLSPLLEHAYHHVPYYKAAFDKIGLKPFDVKKTADLCCIKPIGKQEVLADPRAFMADNAAAFRARIRATGGTTGQTFLYYQDIRSWALNWALKIRTFEWAGYRYGKDRLGVMAGGSLTPQRSSSLSNLLWRKLNNYYSMPITHLDGEIMEEYFKQLQSQRIRFLRGYPSALAVFASYLREEGRTLPMRAVFTTAEILYPYQRELMRKVFCCEVYDTYGCGDGMGHATECELHDGLHVCPEVSVMQIVDNQGDLVCSGEEGEIVLTSLFDYTMPLIRYMPGDRAVVRSGTCSCGRGAVMLERIVGRVSDVFHLSNGRIVNGLSLPFEEMAKIVRQFQLVQETPSRVVVKIVPRKTLKLNIVEAIRNLMRHHCGEGIDIEVCFVDHIEVPPSGKLRYIVSQVDR